MAKKFKFRYVNEIVGGFVLLVVLLLLAGVVVAGRAQHWFEGSAVLHLKLPQEEGHGEGFMGLKKGAEVILLGTPVGSVQDLLVDDETGAISGTIRVRGSFLRHVKTDMVAWVKKKMVVTGDAYIELGADKDETGADLPVRGQPVAPGGEIVIKKDVEIVQMLQDALEAIRKEAINTLALVNGAIAEYMALGGSLNDPDGSLQLLLANANGLLEDVRKGPGLPAQILNDPAMAQQVQAIVAEVRQLVEKANAAATELQATVAKLPPMADAVGGEIDNLPAVVGDAQALMRETTALMDGLQKHWLLRKYMGSDDAVRAEEVLVP